MKGTAIFRVPSEVLYGRDAFTQVGEKVAALGRKALVISDPVMERIGYVDRCRQFLQQAGRPHGSYLGVDSEPTDRHVAEALEQFQREQCDVIVSLGGGSCIDTGKAVAILAANGGDISQYVGGKKVVQQPSVPLIAIPTTAGTGSEVTDVTVITQTATDVKLMVKHPALTPAVAIVDPVLTVSSPPHVTASTGVDALCHAVEAYISRRAHPLTDSHARSAIDRIYRYLRRAYKDGKDLEAREQMSLAAMEAGIAFSNASVCLVHGMSRPIGAVFHVPHGVSNAMLLPAVLEFKNEAYRRNLADIGRIFREDGNALTEEEAAHTAVAEVKRLCLELNIPNMANWGIDPHSFESHLEKMAQDAIDSGSPGNHPVVPTQEEIIQLYHECYDYRFSGAISSHR
ncbi:1,3-propanediol dehydrogenase [Melghirimyces thermohalophilus]|uniref:1,3-propanediol dehydrogenase n=1 Tax=Melghirimyces thermohalophilus TaxID=1236220 RepID=A0A1G6KDD9_9BACL|nr:iron-containing alcohol dehydrogenase [Melghirimyces thermohalophilus]SDC29020.1 1,3-propanediol dehydrogenase [Melghirimyces thermohalophilus]